MIEKVTWSNKYQHNVLPRIHEPLDEDNAGCVCEIGFNSKGSIMEGGNTRIYLDDISWGKDEQGRSPHKKTSLSNQKVFLLEGTIICGKVLF